MVREYKSDIVLYDTLEMYTKESFEVVFTVNIPFVCQNCGTCCKDGYPGTTHTQDMIDHLGISESEIIKMLSCERPESFTGKWLPCPFLKNSFCLIYPVRPECCRRYNGQTQPRWKCPARKRQEEISDSMKKLYLVRKSWSLDICIGKESPLPDLCFSTIDDIKIEDIDQYDRPTRIQWSKIWNSFQKTSPTEDETRLFLILNPASEVNGGFET